MKSAEQEDRGISLSNTKTTLFFGFTLIVAIALALVGLSGCGGQKEASSSSSSASVPAVKETAIKDVYTVLLIGSDTRKGTAQYTGDPSGHAQVDQHGDILTLARIDSKGKVITLVTVPRDSDYNGAKINGGLNVSPEQQVKQVEEVTGASIDYYIETTFVGFPALVDGLGGVDVDVPIAMTLSDPISNTTISLEQGTQTLNGAEALVLARSRKVFADNQDACRQCDVRALEESLIQKVASNPSTLTANMDVLKANTTTNIPADVLSSLVASFAGSKDITFYSATGPYEGGQNTASGDWLVYEDKAAWSQVISAMNAGQDPSGIIPLPEFIAA